MSLIDVDGDPWLREHEACEKLHRDIAAQLSERDNEVPSSSAYGKLSASICVRLKQFSTEVQQLGVKLSIVSHNDRITPHEVERRARLVERLESGIKQLERRFNTRNHGEAETRSHLFAGQARGAKMFADMGTTGWGSDSENSSETFDVDRAQRMTQEVIKEQDAGLDELAKIISRQKAIGNTIGDEVNVQCEILDDLAESIDRTAVGLIKETNQVRTIARKDATCGYWILIIVLFIAILVVAFI